MSEQEIKKAVERTVETMPLRDKIARIRLFGSQLHGTSQPTSDVDLLIDFTEQAAVGYFELVRIERALEEALGRSVDLVTTRSLSKYFRDEVLAEAKTLYEQRLSTP